MQVGKRTSACCQQLTVRAAENPRTLDDFRGAISRFHPLAIDQVVIAGSTLPGRRLSAVTRPEPRNLLPRCQAERRIE